MAGDFETATGLEARALVSNLNTELASLMIGAHVLPMTRNDGIRPTNYMCCPSTAYIDYAREELRHFKPTARRVLGGVIALARPLMRASGLDRQIQPNNGLVATNLLPVLEQDQIEDLTRHLVQQYPDHAIVWRSINDVSTAELKKRFEVSGYRAFASRQIYLFDARTLVPLRRDEARDLKLLRRADYEWACGPWSDADFARMAWLYQKLYLEKYTWLNPVYTTKCLQDWENSGFLEFYGLRGANGRLDGVVGFIERGDTMAAPIVGYDTDLDQDLGLYRRLMAFALKRARERRLIYNMSAGAANFKRSRGGLPALEYMMVYNKHLSPRKRLAARLIRALLDTVGVATLKRFAL